ADAENSVIGKEFYVMERVEGPILRTTLPEDWGWGPQEAEKFCRLFWEKLVDLHQVDYTAIGLGDFGKPKGYVARQVEGWNKRFETALTPDVQPFEDVRDWLDHNQPEDCPQSSLLHGDYRIDNVILNPENPFDIRAVLDWELAALGDPLMDLGAALAYWIEPDDPPELRVLERQPSRAPGMLTRHQIVDLYTERRGLKVDDFTFYYVFGLFRLAGIAQQIYRRYHAGETTNPAFQFFGMGAQNLCQHCRQLINEGMT
ncbi:MAG: phosphotransferase family protein, partial [Pseudomonadota bacterium]